jgi:hypothetical protein
MEKRARERERWNEKGNGGRAISRQNPKLVKNLGAKCQKLIPKVS